jgi:aspartate/methionine/tyrosine aminotransferase
LGRRIKPIFATSLNFVHAESIAVNAVQLGESELIEAFRRVPKTGVIFVMNEAARHGYRADDAGWTNFGQGQPETGQIPGAPERIESVEILEADHEYAPVAGLWELRDAVADHYNRLYRRGMPSQYSAENVCISGGGRAGLTRVAAALGTINLGHFLPDYTAYEELLGLFRLFTSIPIMLDPKRGYAFGADELEQEVLGRGLGALLLSNPCNPTGKLIGGEQLDEWVALGRRLDCTLILDEFYSHYIWNKSPAEATAANYVEDVDTDPVVIVNGLTKSWRYPGWRVSWTLGPCEVVERLSSAGSFLDGGASRPLQRAAVPLLDKDHTAHEIKAIQQTFGNKRDLLVERLRAMGVAIERPPDGTFYVWGDVSNLPEGINTGMDFFQRCLDHQIICVPGEFFDVNPGQRRSGRPSRFRNHVRFSFGPPRESLERGLTRLEEMVSGAGE